jgi:dephospho-CoA kinase
MSPDKMEEKVEEAKKDLSNDSSIAVPYPNQTLIVIGFSGPLGSGCSYISQALAEKFNYKYYKPSDIIREYVDADEKNNVKVLQDKGNEFVINVARNSLNIENTVNAEMN